MLYKLRVHKLTYRFYNINQLIKILEVGAQYVEMCNVIIRFFFRVGHRIKKKIKHKYYSFILDARKFNSKQKSKCLRFK